MNTINESNEGTSRRPNRYRRMTPRELSEAIDKLGLSAGKIARLTGNQRKRILQWLEGTEEIPHIFHALVRVMLEFDDGVSFLLDLANEYIIEQEEPGPVETTPESEEVKELIESIGEVVPEALRVADVWEDENPGRRSQFRYAIREFKRINRSRTKNDPSNIDRLENIAGILGLGIDVNEWIAKQNMPYRQKISQRRRERQAREREIKKAMKPVWQDPWKKDGSE